MTRFRTTRRAVLAVLLFVSTTARADDSDADAERLFREAQKLLEDRRYGEACPKFEAAYKKDGKLGTLLNLAFCHKEQGATWYAWIEFREAEFKAEEQKRPERKDFARKRLDELEKDKSLAKIIVDNPQKVPLTEVDVEDRKIPEAERGAYFTAEEGKRKLTFKAKGKKPATSLVTIVRGDRAQRVVVPDMEDAPVEATPPPPPVDHIEPPPPKPSEANDGSTQRTLGWVGIGVGSAVFVAGSVFGVLTLTNRCAALGSGDTAPCKDPNSSDNKSKDTTGLVATIGMVGGAVIGVGGLVLLLTAPSSKSAEKTGIALDVGLGYYGVRGTF